MRLGVNIDHIATLRQARQEAFPDPVEAAKAAIAGGADGIVCHLREDRRHIQDDDVLRLRKLNTRLDFEMAATDEMVKIALRIKPEMVTLVPEKRQEITTEGGLDVKSQITKYKSQTNPKSQFINKIKKLQKAGILVSLFIDPEIKQVEAAAEVMADFVELHTGRYARASYVKGKKNSIALELEKIGVATQKARWIGLRVNAGHGLDYNNVKPIAGIAGMEELNIGFSIIARAAIVGMKQAVIEMREAM
ncbi:MAG: pyridoxine 5'-phosphate synthase [Candidatus Margulisiibacteriota bacterium]